MHRTTTLDTGWEFARSEWLAGLPFGYMRSPRWLPATAPGYVHLDLVANGIIRDPFEEMAELGCQWVDECDWCYRTQFSWSPLAGAERRLLRFDGLDTVCTIFLNGQEIGRHDNMFLPFEIDVSDVLIEGENELRVDFQSAARVGRERRATYFAENGIAGDVLNFEERAFVRKAQYMFGWDWGPRLVSCGIWKPIRLIEGDAASDFGRQSPPRVALRREADAFGESFEFIVDGKPFWARGANWIPIDSFPSRSEGLRELLLSFKAMNFNMLRVWGGGLYESDELYDLCDELDILVWQDFAFACSYSPDDEAFAEQIRKEATYHVKRLRRHRCLALWCGNNENLTMWEGKWGGDDKQSSRFHGERIWNEVLREVVAEHDPGRVYIPTSPIGSPPGKTDCNAGGYGDSHYWDVWHGRGDWVHYSDSTARFSSEFGFPSSCGMRAWERVRPSTPLPPSSFSRVVGVEAPAVSRHEENKEGGLSPVAPVVRWHDKTGRPFSYWLELLTKHYPEPRDLDEWIYYSQLNQRDAMRHAVEHYRRSEFCKGTLIWQANDCWPVQSWSLIDSEGGWKAAAYELERLYDDCLLSYERVGDTMRVWGINDGEDVWEIAGWERVGAYDSLSGEQLFSVPIPAVTLRGCERRVLLAIDVSELSPTRTILCANTAFDPARLLCEPKDLELARPTIRARIERDGVLEVVTDVPVVDLYLWDSTGGADFRVRPQGTPGGNFRTFETSCPWSYTYSGTIGRLMGRSLAGVHEIEIVDGPIWP
ncbi:MAG TPA: hypothetical protein VHE55_13500 [Fimbriimonadaceae bacterium]|nr:hypothetical protein [Fimbriimonadaceae bacterium]